MDAYEDRNAVSRSRIKTRHGHEPEFRRSRAHAYEDDDMNLDTGPLMDVAVWFPQHSME